MIYCVTRGMGEKSPLLGENFSLTFSNVIGSRGRGFKE